MPNPIDVVLARLQGVNQAGRNQWECRCPAHDDRRASLSVSTGSDGAVLLKCHAGCNVNDITASLGLTVRDLFPSNGGKQKGKRKRGRIVAEYRYTDEQGNELFRVHRFDPKDFRQSRPGPNGDRIWKMTGCRRVPYKLPELLKAAREGGVAFVVEGERDVDRLQWFYPATCNPGGAGKWRLEYSEHFRGLRQVVIVPDADEPGRMHAKQVAEALVDVVSDIRIVELPGAKDVSEWLDIKGNTIGKLLALAKETPPWTPDWAPVAAGDNPEGQGQGKTPPDAAGTTRTSRAPMPQYPRSDEGNAQRFVAEHGKRVRYCPPRGCWLLWDGRRWQEDDCGGVEELARQTARHMLEQAINVADEKERHAAVKFALHTQASSRLEAMVKVARSTPLIVVRPADLDADPWMLNVQNGTLDLRTGEIHPHRREDLITKIAPVDFDPEATSEVWARYLQTATGGDAELADYLARCAGYSLTGSVREDVLFLLLGPGGSGKSTFATALRAALGDFAATSDFEVFVESAKRGAGPRPELVRLVGARAVFSIEVQRGRKLAEALIKALSGGDTIAVRDLYSKGFEFEPTAKLWLIANDPPRARADDDAIWRRIVRVPFERVIPETEQDPDLRDVKIREPEQRAAVLAWAVRGCLDWQRDGLRPPQTVKDATAELRSSMNQTAGFLEDCCTLHPDCRTPKGELREAYATWCRENGEREAGARTFNAELRALGCTDGRTRHKRLWQGIGLLDEHNDDPEPPKGDKVTRGDNESLNFSIRARAREVKENAVTSCHPVTPPPREDLADRLGKIGARPETTQEIKDLLAKAYAALDADDMQEASRVLERVEGQVEVGEV